MQLILLPGLRRLAADRNGAVAIIFGLSVMVLFTVIGIALDSSRAYNISSRVQNVLDAAALAGARKLALEETDNGAVQETSLQYFAGQENQFKIWGAVPTNPRVVIDRENFTVTMTADVTMSSIAGSLSNLLPEISFTPTATAKYEVKRVELSMVLDITGSMSWPGGDGAPKLNGLKEAAKDVINILSNATSAPGLIRVGVVPYSASVNAGPYFDAVTYESRGDTCVVERDGPDAYNDDPISNGSHIEVVAAPPPAFYSCPSSQVVPLTDVANATGRKLLIDHLNAMTAGGGTAGHIGTAWGWYMLSPKWTAIWPSASDPKPYGPKVTKALLLMTDGDFNVAYENGGETVPWPNPGATDINMTGSSPNQAKTLCQNIRAAGVRIYSVAFMAPPAAEALLKECAGESNYYDAANTAQLKAAFRDIATKLTSISISQ